MDMMEVFEKTSQRAIEELEQKLGFLLPADYKSFLLLFNGGRPGADTFAICDQQGNVVDNSVVDIFYGIDLTAHDTNILWNFNIYKNRIPLGLIPIACDVFGNLIVLSVHEQHYGAIFFWDHEVELFYEENQWINIYFLAGSFTAFCKSLKDTSARMESITG